MSRSLLFDSHRLPGREGGNSTVSEPFAFRVNCGVSMRAKEMRKLILLALAVGAYGLLRRNAANKDTTIWSLFTLKLNDIFEWHTRPSNAPAPEEN